MRPAQPAALQQRFLPAPLALAAAMAIALATGHAPRAHAQSSAAAAAAAPIAINIQAQPLGQALNELARQANLQMTFPAGMVAGKSAQAVTGQLTVRQALDRLLSGSGLSAIQEGTSVVIQAIPPSRVNPASADERTLPLIRITAAREAFRPEAIHLEHRDIERSNPSDLQDLFRGQAAIQVGSSLPVSQKLYVNGVEETNLATTIDGSRQNNKIFHHNATTLIDPTLLKAVRVDPGVAPADAGPGALAGAVAYETLAASELLEPGRSFGGRVKGEFESNGDISAASGALYGQQGGFEYLGHLKHATGQPRQDGAGQQIIGSGTRMLSGLGKIAFQAESGHRVQLSHESVQDDEARPYRADMGRVLGGRPMPLTRDYDLHRQNTALTYTDAKATGWWNPRIQLSRSVTDLRIPEASQVTTGRTESLNGKAENRFTLARGSVTAGLDFFDDQADTDYRYLPNPALNEGGKERLRNLGLYAQARLDLAAHARVSFGARHDAQRFTGVDGVRRSDAGTSYNVTGELDVTRGWTVSAGYSDVWAGIPLAENFIISPAWRYPGEMTAVTADNAFVGLRAELDGVLKGWALDGRVFRTDIKDARTPDYRRGPNLRKDMSSEGYELGGTYTWGAGFARLRYADIDTRIDGNPAESYTGRYLTTPIGRIISLEAVHSLAERRWTVGANAQIVLKETNTFNEATGSRALPLAGYEVANVFVAYRPVQWRQLTLRAEVNNLFDKTYTSRATYGQEYADVVPLREPGRSIKLMASYHF
ncbi:MAG: hypothetical protein RL654_1178 [Pseudomonadota bacterium]|jgi:hemoglobin/transferrin/lactoferrin receptor protein